MILIHLNKYQIYKDFLLNLKFLHLYFVYSQKIKIYHLDFIKLTAFAKAAYLTGENNKEENIINMLKKSIFLMKKKKIIKLKT